MIDEVRLRLIWKIALYYGVCFAILYLVWRYQPQWFIYLPFDGIDILREDIGFFGAESLEEQLATSGKPDLLFEDATNLVTALIGTLIVMVPIRGVYMKRGLAKLRDAEVATGLLALPLIVTAIVYIVKYSLPLAFALAGIFAGVRYRTTLKRQSDAYFTFASIAVGLAAGTGALGIALALAVFFTFTLLVAPPRLTDPIHNTKPNES